MLYCLREFPFLLASELFVRVSAFNAVIFWFSSLHCLKTPVTACCSTLRNNHYLSALNLPSSAIAFSTYSPQLKLPFYFPVFGCYGYVVYFKQQSSNQNSKPGKGLWQEQYHLLQSRTSINSCSPMIILPRTSHQPVSATLPGQGCTKQTLNSFTVEGLSYSLRE